MPIPPKSVHERKAAMFQALLERMAPGDSIVLETNLAAAVLAFARKTGVAMTKRKLDETSVGLWKAEA